MGLSTDWTLANFKAQVRAQTSTISKQTSGIIEKQMNDLVHASIVIVRSTLDKIVDDNYKVVSSALAFAAIGTGVTAGLCVLTTALTGVAKPYDLRVSKNSLYDGTLKEIPLFTKLEFDARRTILTTTDLTTTGGIGTLFSTTAGDVQVSVYTGAAASPTTTLLTYLRPPTKEAIDANTVDLPDRWVPLAIDHCTMAVFRRVSKAPPQDVEARVAANATAIAQMLSLPTD